MTILDGIEKQNNGGNPVLRYVFMFFSDRGLISEGITLKRVFGKEEFQLRKSEKRFLVTSVIFSFYINSKLKQKCRTACLRDTIFLISCKNSNFFFYLFALSWNTLNDFLCWNTFEITINTFFLDPSSLRTRPTVISELKHEDKWDAAMIADEPQLRKSNKATINWVV